MNSVNLIGRLTKDPELRRTGNGMSFCSFDLAVNRRKKDDGTDFIRCKAFGKTAENLCQYQGKGSQIAVSGNIQTGSYVNQQGQKVYTTDVMAQSIEFLGARQKEQSAGDYLPPEYQSNYQQPIADPYAEAASIDSGDLPF